jgi:hypothetical protein
MENECRSMKKELLRLCWYMRGGMTLAEAYQIDFETREVISEIIKDNLETTKDTGLAFF